MRTVVIESPYAGTNGHTVEANVAYAERALKDCIQRGEAPIASHLLFPGVFDDAVKEERDTCMAAGHAWIRYADAMVVYEDYGISEGMRRGIAIASGCGVPYLLP